MYQVYYVGKVVCIAKENIDKKVVEKMATPNEELARSLASRKAAQENAFVDPRTLPGLLPPPPLQHDTILPSAVAAAATVAKSGSLFFSASAPSALSSSDVGVVLSVSLSQSPTPAAAIAAAVPSAPGALAAPAPVFVEAWTVLAVERYTPSWTSFLSSYTPAATVASASVLPAGALHLSAPAAAKAFGLPPGCVLLPSTATALVGVGANSLAVRLAIAELAPETAYIFRARTAALQLTSTGRVALRTAAGDDSGAAAAALPTLGAADYSLSWAGAPPSPDSGHVNTLSKAAHTQAVARAALAAAAAAEEQRLLADKMAAAVRTSRRGAGALSRCGGAAGRCCAARRSNE